MRPINRLVIDSTGASSDMCVLGAEFGTDKSPYSATWHHHPYTAIYDFLFANLRYAPIRLGEIGILDNKSMHMWRSYFTEAQLYGFEFDRDKIEAAKREMLPGVSYTEADVASRDSLFRAFNSVGCKFDILIDDSTHLFEHQISFIGVAIDFVKAGGMIVVEDVFRRWDEARYADALAPLMSFFASATFVETNHERAYSGGTANEPYYDNDKLLVLHRNQNLRKLKTSGL